MPSFVIEASDLLEAIEFLEENGEDLDEGYLEIVIDPANLASTIRINRFYRHAGGYFIRNEGLIIKEINPNLIGDKEH